MFKNFSQIFHPWIIYQTFVKNLQKFPPSSHVPRFSLMNTKVVSFGSVSFVMSKITYVARALYLNYPGRKNGRVFNVTSDRSIGN